MRILSVLDTSEEDNGTVDDSSIPKCISIKRINGSAFLFNTVLRQLLDDLNELNDYEFQPKAK